MYSLNDSWTLNEDMTDGKKLISTKTFNVGDNGVLQIYPYICEDGDMAESAKGTLEYMSEYLESSDSAVSEVSLNDVTGYENVFTVKDQKYRAAIVGKNNYMLGYSYHAPVDEYDTYVQEILDFEKTIQYSEELTAQYTEEEANRYHVTECGGLTFDTPEEWEGSLQKTNIGFVVMEITEDAAQWNNVTVNGTSVRTYLNVYQDASQYDVDAICADYEASAAEEGLTLESEDISSNGFTGRLYCSTKEGNYASNVIAIASDGIRLYELDLNFDTYFNDITAEEVRDYIRDFVNSIREE